MAKTLCVVAALHVGLVDTTKFAVNRYGKAGLQSATAPANAVDLTVKGLDDWLRLSADEKQQPLPSSQYLQNNADYALRARQEVPVAAHVPQALFERFVLPYRQLDEPVDDWRQGFFEVLAPHAKGAASLREAAEAVYPKVWTDLRSSPAVMGASNTNTTAVTFKANCTPAIMAPVSQTLKVGHASCTGSSILVANSLRAVGIPARVVGTPKWNIATGGNHNWVEMWTGEGSADGWHYFDAAPGDKLELDKGWFVPSNTKEAVSGSEHGIFAASWDVPENKVDYPYTWRDPATTWPAVDRTAFYQSLSA